MTFRCLDENKRIVREAKWLFIKGAWVSIVTVCTYKLYPRNRVLINTDIPDVSNLNLSLENLGLLISWNSNSSYDTEISYSKNETNWEEIIIEGNETIIDLNPDDTLQVRARFTDGNGNYSANYTTASITVWNMEDFTLYGLTENVNNGISEANTIYTINYGDEFYADKLKTFTVENTEEDNHKIFFFNSLIYRLVYRYRYSYQGYEFESIDPVTLVVTPINLISTNPNIFDCGVQAMCFNQTTQYAYISTACGFYRLELNGFVEQLSTDNNGIKAMTFYNDQLLSLEDNNTNGPIKCYVIDPSNGTRTEPELFTITIPGYTTTSAHSLITHDGDLYAVVNGNNGVDYAGLIFISINIFNDYTISGSLYDSSGTNISLPITLPAEQANVWRLDETKYLIENNGVWELGIDGSTWLSNEDTQTLPQNCSWYVENSHYGNVSLTFNAAVALFYNVAGPLYDDNSNQLDLTFSYLRGSGNFFQNTDSSISLGHDGVGGPWSLLVGGWEWVSNESSTTNPQDCTWFATAGSSGTPTFTELGNSENYSFNNVLYDSSNTLLNINNLYLFATNQWCSTEGDFANSTATLTNNGANPGEGPWILTVDGYEWRSFENWNIWSPDNANWRVAGYNGGSFQLAPINGAFISQLTDPSRTLGSIYVNEESSLVIQQTYQNFSGLYNLSEEGVIGELIIDTKTCCNIEEYQAFAFNPVDRHIYHACMRVRDYDDQDEEYNASDNLDFVFEKLNPDTLEVTQIQTSGIDYNRGTEFQTESYIDDGGNDMYDDGNFLGTNRSQNGFIEYTHTQQSESDWENFQQIADGAIENGHSDEDGYNYFGVGSKYFTNMYEGLFVMVAKDIDITSFAIYGELGADGNGLVDRDTITLNNGHTGYFKKVYNANDPSVNQLIIIPSKSNVIQRISYSTHKDFHSVENLSGVDYIYYLLFSSEESEENEITSEQAQIIGNSFLNTITGPNMTIENILTRLNSGVTNITQNIPNMFAFTDWSDGISYEYIGYRPGLSQPHCMTYQSGNKFLITSDEGLYSITTDGFVSLINSAFHWQECRGLAFVGNRLFGCFASVDQIAEIDPYTGDIISQVNKKGWSVVVDAGENQLYTYSIRAIAGNDDGLFIMSHDDNSTYTIAFISNLEPDENNVLYATSLGVFRVSGGLTLEKFGRTAPPGRWFWDYNEESTGIRVPSSLALSEMSAEELDVQWHEDSNADQSYTDWQDIAVQEVIQPQGGEGSDFVVVIDKPVNNFMTRMRFNNPVSKWSYYRRD